MVITRAIQINEFERIESFYRENEYQPAIEPSDMFLVAEHGDTIRAALRLSREQGCLVLRGMRVSPPFQGRGIGSLLLQFAREEIGDKVCYCIPYDHLRDFYAQIGFEQIAPDEAPEFLRERCERYRSEYGLDVLLMRKPAPIRQAAR